jgi:hypothetical protein
MEYIWLFKLAVKTLVHEIWQVKVRNNLPGGAQLLISPLLEFTSAIAWKIDNDLSSEIDFKTFARDLLLVLLYCKDNASSRLLK